MRQTFGNQFFGPWYDTIGWIVGSAVFLYFAVAAEGMPVQLKEKLPALLLNKKVCFMMGGVMALLAVSKAMEWW